MLEVEGLRKSYGDKVVLAGVDLTVARHEVVCLIGASGSGKSTLLRCIDLLEDSDDGTVRFEGRDVTDPRVDRREVQRRIGVVFQAYNLFPHLTVLDNITLAPRRVHGVARGARRGAGARAARAVRAGRQGGRPPRPALRRPAATCRGGAGARHRPGPAAPRRGDRGARPGAGGGGARHPAGAGHGGTTMVLATHEIGFAREMATTVCFLEAGASSSRPARRGLVSPRRSAPAPSSAACSERRSLGA